VNGTKSIGAGLRDQWKATSSVLLINCCSVLWCFQ